MTLLLYYIHIIIKQVSSLKARSKPETYLGPGNVLHDMEYCYTLILERFVGGKIFTVAFLLAVAFFFNCMKMSSAKDVSSALKRWS